ncbi:hypothetical protein [Methylobacterium sp. GC_Met_2]|uniref:hypothetical protein n=1 Tax=Methylobacterium sp. GC_Met_2 TaxID=2937376 RepID=UPI00226B687C|nr:hypothetical protein [Methylobacterium sp. GC_Met_2]
MDETRHFYREFPKSLQREFDKTPISGDASEGLCPQVWKTVGDEIIFCIRLVHSQHMGRCVWAFIRTLEYYSRFLEASKIELDVKGVAWTAAFPAPNITVPIALKHVEVDASPIGLQDHEPIEQEGDKEPSRFEFLGKEIDAGFRVAKNASSDRLALSLEAAYLLSDICALGDYTFVFTYEGREALKGVIGGRPYPVISIDTERRSFRREVRAFEQSISGDKEAKPHLLKTFLDAFMKDEKIEPPYLLRKSEAFEDHKLPETYRTFRKFWLEEQKEDDQRTKVEEQSEDETAQHNDNASITETDAESLAAIKASADELFNRFRDQH